MRKGQNKPAEEGGQEVYDAKEESNYDRRQTGNSAIRRNNVICSISTFFSFLVPLSFLFFSFSLPSIAWVREGTPPFFCRDESTAPRRREHLHSERRSVFMAKDNPLPN